MRVIVKKTPHSQLSVFCLFYFHWSYYNKYFERYLQIKWLLVVLTDNSIVNKRNQVKDTKLTTQFFLVCFIFIHLVLLQQVFCKKAANQIIISTYN